MKPINQFLILVLLAISANCYSQLIINEIQADNKSTLKDASGDTPDWIELFNNSENSISLNDYFLSDDKDDLLKWQLPNISLSAQSYFVILASGINQNLKNEYHCNFKISADGESIFLSDENENILQEYPNLFSETDLSIGIYNDEIISLSVPTPGNENIYFTDEIVFSHKEGSYPSRIDLNLSNNTNGEIYYTLNGNEPTTNSFKFTTDIICDNQDDSPLIYSLIPSTTLQEELSYKAWSIPFNSKPQLHTIRCRTFENGIPTSKIFTKQYLVGHQFSDWHEIPIISITVDSLDLYDFDTGIYIPGIHFSDDDPEWTGNFFQKGWDWEKPANLIMFVNDEVVLNQNIGIRIHGAKTRQSAQKSLRLIARGKYGNHSFSYPFIGDKEKSNYDSFILRTSLGSWFGDTMIKDELIQKICKSLNFESMDSQPAILYLNGEYWGIYTIRDRINEIHLAEKFNLESDEIEIWDWYNQHFYNMIDYIENNDLSEEANYNYISQQMDIDNFIDYMIAQIYFKNQDWPANNNEFWRPLKEDGKWRWIFFDLDAAIPNRQDDMLKKIIDSEADNRTPLIFRSLLENKSFKENFVNRYLYLIENEFSSFNMLTILDEIKSTYDLHIQDHINRWNYPETKEKWDKVITDNISTFLYERPCEAIEELITNFDELNIAPCDKKNFTFDIYPNPTTEFINLILDDTFYIESVTIFNTAGQIICSIDPEHIRNNKRIDVSDFAPGIYFLNYRNKDHTYTKKFIKR